MDQRKQQLIELEEYTKRIEIEMTLILQNLQWHKNKSLQGSGMVICKYDSNHRMPSEVLQSHEEFCALQSQGYLKTDSTFPAPLDNNAFKLVKLSKQDIRSIINKASQFDPSFKKGPGCEGPEPLSLERLQSTYTTDERRAIHNAVVQAVPTCHDLADLALPSSTGDELRSKRKSRMEILAELRDMKRRRTKYRVAPNTRNYSMVLRDVIQTQMEMYNGAAEVKKEVLHSSSENHKSLSNKESYVKDEPRNEKDYRYNHYQDSNRRRESEVEKRKEKGYSRRDKEGLVFEQELNVVHHNDGKKYSKEHRTEYRRMRQKGENSREKSQHYDRSGKYTKKEENPKEYVKYDRKHHSHYYDGYRTSSSPSNYKRRYEHEKGLETHSKEREQESHGKKYKHKSPSSSYSSASKDSSYNERSKRKDS